MNFSKQLQQGPTSFDQQSAVSSTTTSTTSSSSTTTTSHIKINSIARRIGSVTSIVGVGNVTDEEFVDLLVSDINLLQGFWTHFPFVYKIGEGSTCNNNGPILLHQVCRERGWREFSPFNTDSYGNPLQAWNLHWATGKLSSSKNTYSWQVSNHSNLYSAGRSYSFTMKNGCSRYLKRLQNSFGSAFDFGPLTFNLPSDYARLCSEHSKRKKAFLMKLFSWEFEMSLQQEPGCPSSTSLYSRKLVDPPKDIIRPIWICKPVGKSRGRGIFVFDSPEKLNYMKHCVVQEYITRPYLIGGYKWDLRLYVCIVSRVPLVIYTYTEGLVRFSTSKFNLNHLSNIFSHLTNTSVNRESPEYMEVKAEIGKGCKWSLKRLRLFWKTHDVDDWYFWQRVWKVIILTIIGDTSNICKTESMGHHFDLLGFDIIIDENMKPYLLEVNTNPALSLDCEVDENVKRAMLHDLFDLLGLPDVNHFHNNSQSECTSPTTRFHKSELMKCQHNENNDGNGVPQKVSVPSASPSQFSDSRNTKVPKFSSTTATNVTNKNSLGVTHISGARNAFNEIINLISRPKLNSKHFVHDNNDLMALLLRNESSSSSNEDVFEDQLAFIQQQYYSPNPASSYRLNAYFQTVGLPGQMHIYPQLHIKIPIRKRQCRVRYPMNYLDKWRTGLILEVRDWTKGHHYNNPTRETCPEQVGGWIRSYPFDLATYNLSNNSKNFDTRTAIQHVNNYMKVAREISLEKISNCHERKKLNSSNNASVILNPSNCSDLQFDQMLMKQMQLNTKVWHPNLTSSQSVLLIPAKSPVLEL